MLGCSITDMAFQAITGKPSRQTLDQRITALFRDHAGSRDRRGVSVASHDAALFTKPGAQGQIAIHQHQLRAIRQPLQSPQHRQLSGGTNPEEVDLASGDVVLQQSICLHQLHLPAPEIQDSFC